MRAKDLMQRDVLAVQEDDSVDDLLDALVGKHIHGAPVLNERGDLVGMVSQLDVYVGAFTRSPSLKDTVAPPFDASLKVKEIMTSPAVSATEETPIEDICRMMHRLRIHRVPVVRQGRVTGVVSSLDICAAVGRGDKLD